MGNKKGKSMKNKKMPAREATHTADNKTHRNNTSKPALSQITKETRRESYITRPETRKSEILSTLKSYGDMTSREISYRLGYLDLNAVKPRLSELLKSGKVEVVRKQEDYITGKKVAVYRRKENV